MKHLFLAATAALILGACSTTHSSDKMMKSDSEKTMTDESMMEKETMTAPETVLETESMMTEEPAAPAASVDCTGLSDDACMAKIMNFGNEPTPAEAAPVTPVEAEPMMDDAAATDSQG